MSNRLARESSPYLLQHKDNPVDWYPWGEEAFARARAEDKPLFVSIGYAACHWCHVMEHESFENQEIAALMNEHFVNVKVDREERPDVDTIYMNAIHVMGEGGGWPLSAFCTPDGKPFYLGTYFPPADRYGRPGFPKLLAAMSGAWREQRDSVLANTEALIEGLRQVDEHYRRSAGTGAIGDLEPGILVTSGRSLAQRSDNVNGGLGTKPKFPSSSSHDLLGRCGRRSFGAPARDAYLLQARKMADGGIYDHLGGGFSRYSVDERWLVPHFEKMLYDNAQLLGIYGDVAAMTGEAWPAAVIDETVGWLEREMRHGSGALYASQDADSEGEEGKFYVWNTAEITAALGPADAIQFCRAYGVTPHGNFEHTGKSVLSRVTARGPASDEAALAGMRQRLFEVRRKRVPPATDTKILAAWNGMAISGLLRAWEATGHAGALALARGAAEFLAGTMLHGEGRLWRVAKDDGEGAGPMKVKLDGTLDDYACVALAFLDMAEATGDAIWWQRGAGLLASVRARFYEERDGVGIFFLTPSDDEGLLVHRPESHHDGATPSGASVAVEGLLRLGLVAGDAEALGIAERYLAARSSGAAENPFGGSRLLASVDLYLDAMELVVTGGTGREALLEAARRSYAPTLLIAGSWAQASILDGKSDSPDGKAQAYLCRGQTCSPPTSDPEAVRTLLSPLGPTA
jgi:uncharacterized protein